MIVIIPAHNQSLPLAYSLRGYLRQSQMPTHIVVVLDRCTDDTETVANIYVDQFAALGCDLHIIKTDESISGFGAGYTRDCGLKYAKTLGNGPFLFTDGDCIPSFRLVEEHSRAVEGQQGAAVCCGLRYETGVTSPDSKMVEIEPGVYDDIRNFADHLKGLVTGIDNRLVINPEVVRNSWVCWSCNMSMNIQAVEMCIETNALLVDDQDSRVFCKSFDGKWGGEDGFVGLTVFRRGGRVIMMGRKSHVVHQWHSRSHTNDNHLLVVDAMDKALETAIRTGMIDAPKTLLVFARQPPTDEITEASLHLAYASFPPSLAQVMTLLPKDSLFLSVAPLFISQSIWVRVDYSQKSMLASVHENRAYVLRCVNILKHLDVIALPDGRLTLNPASNLDVSKEP